MAQPMLQQPEYYLGIRGGVAANTVMFGPSVPNMYPVHKGCNLSPQGALVFRYLGHKYCGLQIEAAYQQLGWAEREDEHETYTRRLHYIEMPFMAHIYLGKKSWRGIFNLGPQIGYCFYDDGGRGEPYTTDGPQYKPIDLRFDWAVTGGAGFHYTHPKVGILEFEARFQYSLGTIFGNSKADHFSEMSNPMVLSANILWLWRVEKKKKNNNTK